MYIYISLSGFKNNLCCNLLTLKIT